MPQRQIPQQQLTDKDIAGDVLTELSIWLRDICWYLGLKTKIYAKPLKIFMIKI